jgi:hypothetical protein
MRTIRKRNRFLRRIVLGFAVAALAAPAATQARVDEGGVASSSKNTEARVILDPPAPQGQSSWPGVDPASGQSYPVWISPTEPAAADGFGWGDAGIGAGIALGLVVLGGAAFRVTTHRGKAQTA